MPDEQVERRRAYIYLTRQHVGRLELAVFRHPDLETMVLGYQVPGGTIEPHETPEAGALREAFEESGLDDFVVIRLLATDVRNFPTEREERFFYQLSVDQSSPDSWSHTVSDGELDKGMVFDYRWLTVPEAKHILSHMGDYLHLLEPQPDNETRRTDD
jgi:8-oxo-dGTP pyrophosphatase MutT (NUDIX family)